jgi:hypothetical protein
MNYGRDATPSSDVAVVQRRKRMAGEAQRGAEAYVILGVLGRGEY